MDPIYKYKDKLHEALTLIPSMSSSNQIEAVNHWNTVATQIRTLLDDEESSSSSHGSEHSDPVPSLVQIEQHNLPAETPSALSLSTIHGEPNIYQPSTSAQLEAAPGRLIKIEAQTTPQHLNEEQHTYFNDEPAQISTCPPTLIRIGRYPSQDSTNATITSEVSSVARQSSLLADDTVSSPTEQIYRDGDGQQSTADGLLLTNTSRDDAILGSFQPAEDIEHREHSSMCIEVPREITNRETASLRNADLMVECQLGQDNGPTSGPMHDQSYQPVPNPDAFAPLDDVLRCSQLHSFDQSLSGILYLDPIVTSASIVQVVDDEGNQAHTQGNTAPIDGFPSDGSTCNICGKTGFSTKGNLNRHIKTHSGEKPFECGVCQSKFTEKKSLKIHERKHTGERPYRCNLCDKEFTQTGALQTHLGTHNERRRFGCSRCDKSFRQRSQLKIHEMRHAGVKNLACTRCEAKFLTKGDFDRHFRSHTGERPFQCPHCKKGFTRQQSLNEHMNRHTGRNVHTCTQCHMSFPGPRALLKHIESHKEQKTSDETIQASGITSATS